MKNLLFIATACIGLYSNAQSPDLGNITVVSAGAVPKAGNTVVKSKSSLIEGEYDRQTGMYIAEPQYECLYNYVINNTNGDSPVKETTTCVLQIGDGVGRFCDYTVFTTDSARYGTGADDMELMQLANREHKNIYGYDEMVFQNLPAGEMTVYGNIAPNFFVYTENLNPIQWQIGEATDTVCGYECMTAVGDYGGRRWQVWFTPDIPVTMGPWKFSGLPGLIMKAADLDGVHSFEAIGFRKGLMPVYKPNWPDAISTDREKFIKKKNEFENTPDKIKKIPMEAIRSVTVLKSSDNEPSMVFNGVVVRNRENGYIPREIE